MRLAGLESLADSRNHIEIGFDTGQQKLHISQLGSIKFARFDWK
jgi:hypothetical protein